VEPLIYYKPPGTEHERISWYGGESTMLHYETLRYGSWEDLTVRTIMLGMPSDIKELQQEMVDFYNDYQ
jgi:hypothetical protein